MQFWMLALQKIHPVGIFLNNSIWKVFHDFLIKTQISASCREVYSEEQKRKVLYFIKLDTHAD